MSVGAEHQYSKWEEAQAAVLRNLQGKEVWVLFSGGKDSSLALYFFHRAAKEFDFRFTAHTGLFPKHRYSQADVSRIDRFWKERGVQVRWHKLKMSDKSLGVGGNPCATCQRARKMILYEVVRAQVGNLEDLVLVTAYTLSDLMSYSLEYVTGGTCRKHDGRKVELSRERFIETAQRFYPVLKMNEGFTIYRPLLKFNTEDIVHAVQEADLPILSTPCLYARFRPKRMLESYYQSAGIEFDYDRLLEFARTCLRLPSIDEYASVNKELFLKRLF
jgi:tRNA(Ile)-lysidine synthase TilS/MesJ